MNITDRINLPEVSGGYSNSKIIRTANGVFHTGMTLDEARMIGRDKCVLRRDFENLDKNKDSILTNDEILLEREREAKMLKLDAILMAGFAIYDNNYVYVYSSKDATLDINNCSITVKSINNNICSHIITTKKTAK